MTVVLGITLNLIGVTLINLGTNLLKQHHEMKMSRIERANQEDYKYKPCLNKLKKVSIMITVSLGSILNFVSFAFAPQSLLAALGSVQFVANVIFGKLLLDITPSFLIGFSTAVIVAGNVIVVMFSPESKESVAYDADELLELYTETTYIIYVAFILSMIIVCIMVLRVASRSESPSLAAPIAFALSSAAVGTNAVIFSKSLSMLLYVTLSEESQLMHWYLYTVIALLVICIIFWLKQVNRALQTYHQGNAIIPILQVVWIMFSALGGGVYFKEFNSFTNFQLLMFGSGMAVVLFGVYLLALTSTMESSEEDDEKQDTNLLDTMIEEDGPAKVLKKRKSRIGMLGPNGALFNFVVGGYQDKEVTVEDVNKKLRMSIDFTNSPESNVSQFSETIKMIREKLDAEAMEKMGLGGDNIDLQSASGSFNAASGSLMIPSVNSGRKVSDLGSINFDETQEFSAINFDDSSEDDEAPPPPVPIAPITEDLVIPPPPPKLDDIAPPPEPLCEPSTTIDQVPETIEKDHNSTETVSESIDEVQEPIENVPQDVNEIPHSIEQSSRVAEYPQEDSSHDDDDYSSVIST